MISRMEITKGQKIEENLKDNLDDLLVKMNKLPAIWARPMVVTSGYRSPEYNKKIGGAAKSDHCLCKAVDIYDPKQELQAWCLKNEQILKDIGLWCEHFCKTPNWCHFTTSRKSKTFFMP